jgi:hypothetical protein
MAGTLGECTGTDPAEYVKGRAQLLTCVDVPVLAA